jgi:hypothetical protein
MGVAHLQDVHLVKSALVHGHPSSMFITVRKYVINDVSRTETKAKTLD